MQLLYAQIKTGTLTKNEMTVTDIILADGRRAQVVCSSYSKNALVEHEITNEVL